MLIVCHGTAGCGRHLEALVSIPTPGGVSPSAR